MKKLVLVLTMGLFLSTAAFADHDGLGIGLILGGGGGFFGVGFSPGLSLKTPALPIFWGIYAGLGSNHFGVTVTGDFYIVDKSLVSSTATSEDGTYKVRLDWYFGLGGAVSLNSWHNNFGLGLGLRIPIGLSWHVVTPFEIALGLAPTFGIYLASYSSFWWDINAELVFRLWVK